VTGRHDRGRDESSLPLFCAGLSALAERAFNSFDFFIMLTREAIFPEWSVSLLVFLRCSILSYAALLLQGAENGVG